jgi:hypothetical protein
MSLVDAAWWVWSQLLSPDTPYEADEVSEALLLKAGVMDIVWTGQTVHSSQAGQILQWLPGPDHCKMAM